ncbi:MAG: glycosyltransferase family 4 domain-containing protein [Osedax symbiont Rs2]|nr:MAG: glycosyltransferase family 4 domain-containing protein [Osedax symbiont Rs2]
MKILLLSAYDADSHRYWREHLVANFPEHQWTVLSLPGRYFSWRIRGNSLSWAFGEQSEKLKRQYDLVIATSMTDLSSLRGFIPSLASIPTLVYFHENQFDSPATERARKNVEPQILNIYTALAADKLAFNSQYNLDTFIEGARALLKKLPDQVPTNIATLLSAKSQVLPVPLSRDETGTTATLPQIPWDKYQQQKIDSRPLLIAWAARWEYDKGPQRLLAIVQQLESTNIDYRLCIMGQKFRQVPLEFEQLQQHFGHRIDQFGYAQSAIEYRAWLRRADIFLSTAVHEFQGLAVLEAVAQNCVPILPKRLVYPELFSDEYLYSSEPSIPAEANSAVDLIKKQRLALVESSVIRLDMNLYWEQLKPKYAQLMTETSSVNTNK